MSQRFRPLARLEGAQLQASAPTDHASLSASAGTGKTHVLTARVLRLLLAGADPASILCLTFTKAGAAEMADRIHARLAHWVRLKDNVLALELRALSEDEGPAMRARARRLFARVLDATGGGLRIQTIHAFAQSLLAAFPAEADLVPGFRPLEGREEQLLARSTLAETLVQSEETGDHGLVRDVQALSLRLGEGGAESFLMACARAPAEMERIGPREGIEARLRHVFGLPLGDVEEAIARGCGDVFDLDALGRIMTMNRAWGTKKGLERASICEAWLAADAAARARMVAALHAVWARADGEPRSFARGQAPQDPDYGALAHAAFLCCSRLLSMRALAGFVAALAAGLRAGSAFSLAYQQAKRAAGVVDFDDLIRWTRRLLATPGMGDWVRFKLDQQTDHILVDEAQDTNAGQWEIVEALADEYFAGEGATERARTLFTVGDFKQAIFGFQGTDPRAFDAARRGFAERALPNREAALALRREGRWPLRKPLPPDFLDLSVDLSYRSSPPVLQLVDRLLVELGHDALGLPHPPNPHAPYFADRTGAVTLWAPFTGEDGDEEPGEEGWLSDTVRRYAARLARQIRAWLDAPFHLESKGRPVRPEDILILVRRRGDLAALVVARLHEEKVPVAGVDRLLLSAPLAVQDLLAAARFAVQPLDDLSLASLLVSPLIGWSQERLLETAAGRDGPLWPRLREHRGTDPRTLADLQSILAMADLATPYQFFEQILSGPLDGRRRLVARLGLEARDPIEELLSSALEYESKGSFSLQAFLDWFSRGDVEIVRDPSGPKDMVRVMTVHGSKGLQSPIVILADACVDPDRSRTASGRYVRLDLGSDGPCLPVFRPRREELADPLKTQIEQQDARDREEHWRLLYVAMTRAEERLFVGGALGARDSLPPETSWYHAVEKAMASLGCQWADVDRWGREMRLGAGESSGRAADRADAAPAEVPDWLREAAPAERRPPRPLAPSAIGEDDVALPPPGPDQRQAALRGRLLHQLFERLPDSDPQRREALAAAWLERSAGVDDPAFRDALVADACRIIADPRFSDLFGPGSLAEAPLAAIVGDGLVVSGTVDRLLVTPDRILVADFKTGRNAPSDPEQAPRAHLRQMAAYREALRIIYPGRRVEAGLLYTAIPVFHLIPDRLLDAHFPAAAPTSG